MKIIAVRGFQLKQLKRRNLKNSGLNGNRTHDLCDTGAVLELTELSSQLGAGQLTVRIYPVVGEMNINVQKVVNWTLRQ